MAKIFHLEIITPDKIAYKGKVVSLVAPAEFGYLGVWADHAPLIANLVKGKVIVKEESENKLIWYSKARGFLQVLRNNATLILDDAVSA